MPVVQGYTPMNACVPEWLDEHFPEGDVYVAHTTACDVACCGDECLGGCPIYASEPVEEPRPLMDVLDEYMATRHPEPGAGRSALTGEECC